MLARCGCIGTALLNLNKYDSYFDPFNRNPDKPIETLLVIPIQDPNIIAF